MKKKTSVLKAIVLIVAILTNLFLLPTIPSYAADEYDTLRQRAYDFLTGGPSYNPLDPDIASKITAITDKAQTLWDTMDKRPTRTYLWSGQPYTPKNYNCNWMSGSYQSLEAMALAYCTRGSALYHNSALLADIKSGMDFIYTNWYTMSVPARGWGTQTIGYDPATGKGKDNWYEWQVTAPGCINNICIMLYSSLTSTQIANWFAVVNKQQLQYGAGLVGYNRIIACYIEILNGIINKDSAKIIEGRDQLSSVFDYVTSGEGTYSDGSMIQHTALIAYNGGYGSGLLDNLTKLTYIVAGSTYDITDPDLNNVYQWVYTAIEPLFYNNDMMDMVDGRGISSFKSDNKGLTSPGTIASFVARMAFSAPSSTDRANFKSMVKKWMQTATSPNAYTDLASIDVLVKVKDIVADPTVTPRANLVMNKQYPNMDRAVHLRAGFAFGVSMCSSTVGNYETIGIQNLKGWHTGDGMTYLYNSDLGQYKNSFWPTVNSYRLPGTTVLQNTAAAENSQTVHSPFNQVGGTTIAGQYGATCMQYGSSDYTLRANKSWFMFDDEIICLGSGITSTDNKVVETIVENRQLNANGNNALTVNGTAKSTALGWSETMSGVNKIHLAGNNGSDTDIGYYFPTAVTIKGLRESRTDQWSSIDDKYPTDPEYFVDRTQRYMTLWFDHGTNPNIKTYAYVLLPGKTSAQLDTYASNPNITVVENSTFAHCVKENTLGIVAANFWWGTTRTADIITSNARSSVMIKTNPSDIEIAVSDPTGANTGSINLEFNTAAASTISADAGITVTQYSPTLKLTVDVNGSGGKTFNAKFTRGTTPTNLAAGKTITSSSSYETTDWGSTKAVDSKKSSIAGAMGWTSNNSLTTNHTEQITVDLGSSKTVSRVDLYPRNDDANTGYGFPIDYTIKVSSDNTNWTTVVTKTGCSLPGGTIQRSTFTATSARYVKIEGTNLRPNPNDNNNYRMQFAEFEVY